MSRPGIPKDPSAPTPNERDEKEMTSTPRTGIDRPAHVSARPTLRVAARDLLGPNDVVHIEHEGELYTLRLTRNNKLILTK